MQEAKYVLLGKQLKSVGSDVRVGGCGVWEQMMYSSDCSMLFLEEIVSQLEEGEEMHIRTNLVKRCLGCSVKWGRCLPCQLV